MLRMSRSGYDMAKMQATGVREYNHVVTLDGSWNRVFGVKNGDASGV